MEYLLGGLVQFGGEPVGGNDLAVEVAVKAREVAARDLQADPVAGAEDMGHVPQVDEQLDHLARVEEFCLAMWLR